MRFFRNFGKFLKRLGPVVPTVRWAGYFFPNLVSRSWLLIIYRIFIAYAFISVFVFKPLIERESTGECYGANPGWYMGWKYSYGMYLDVLLTGVMAYSLLSFVGIILFRLPVVTLLEVFTNQQGVSLLAFIIVPLSVLLSLFRYEQKTESIRWKRVAYQQTRTHDKGVRPNNLNHDKDKMQARRHCVTRLICDGMIVFYNIFFVVLSVVFLCFGAQLNMHVLQNYFIWKMVVLSLMCTVKVTIENEKGSEHYFYEKIAKIADVRWNRGEKKFEDRDEVIEAGVFSF